MNFLAHTGVQSRALAASIANRGVEKTAKELRRMIPGELVLGLLVRAAVTGLLPAYDQEGNEVSVATPIDTKTRMDTLRYLANKRVPDPKSTEEEGRELDLSDLPTTLAEARELTPKELDEAIEATFQVTQETPPCPPPQSAPSTTTSPAATAGSSSPATPAATPRPLDRLLSSVKQQQKPTGASASTNPSTSNG